MTDRGSTMAAAMQSKPVFTTSTRVSFYLVLAYFPLGISGWAFIIPLDGISPHFKAGLRVDCRKRVHLPHSSSSSGYYNDSGQDDSIENGRKNDNKIGDNYNDSTNLLHELREMKQVMFGVDIPSNNELQAAARNSEHDFLLAMLEQTQQFHQIKLAEGSDRACEIFMERIEAADSECGRSITRRNNALERHDSLMKNSMSYYDQTWRAWDEFSNTETVTDVEENDSWL